MLTLYLLRHAKSSWGDASQGDFNRPLNKRGRSDAVELGQHLQKTGIHPGLVLVSAATRTCETFQLVAAQLSPPPDSITSKRLYSASPAGLVTEIKNHGGSITSLMVIAHNPGIEALAWQLTAQDPTGALGLVQSKYPTSAMTTLSFDISFWSELAPHSGTLVDFTSPRLRRSD
jgi:phosphohistidine phosphatase